jgi:hypothetical protein
VHYRATVGELFDRMTRNNVPDYDERYSAVKDDYVVQTMRLVKGRDPETYAFFVASDDREFVAEMVSRLPNAFAFDTLRLDREFMSYVIANKHDISILVDAVTDLWALSQCPQLIYSRSAFTHFAIMNSAHLDAGNTFYIHMPMFEEILDSLPPATAVEWASAAVRKIDISRMNFEKMHHVLARSLRRTGRDDAAALYTRRAMWHFEASHAPEIANPDVFAERAERSRGITDFAVRRTRYAILSMPENHTSAAAMVGASARCCSGEARCRQPSRRRARRLRSIHWTHSYTIIWEACLRSLETPTRHRPVSTQRWASHPTWQSSTPISAPARPSLAR